MWDVSFKIITYLSPGYYYLLLPVILHSIIMSVLSRFTRFHGMLCSPADARLCIADLTGSILFMPAHYKNKGIRSYLCTNLNLLVYYSLVLASFTGLSTLLGVTDIVCVEENLDDGLRIPEFESDPEILHVVLHPDTISLDTGVDSTDMRTDSVTEYSNSTSCNDAKVIRRFAYNFRLPMISVQMFHVISDRNPEVLHLVEIYETKNRLSFIFFFGGFLVASYKLSC
jgi:hypothetical protein